jgi:hypothetical protein
MCLICISSVFITVIKNSKKKKNYNHKKIKNTFLKHVDPCKLKFEYKIWVGIHKATFQLLPIIIGVGVPHYQSDQVFSCLALERKTPPTLKMIVRLSPEV